MFLEKLHGKGSTTVLIDGVFDIGAVQAVHLLKKIVK